jgi:hypothetical protein
MSGLLVSIVHNSYEKKKKEEEDLLYSFSVHVNDEVPLYLEFLF